MNTFDLTTRSANYAGCTIEVGRYPKQSPGEPDQVGWRVMWGGEYIGSPTVNLWDPPVFPAEGCVFIKITRQFEGWLESLERAELVEQTGRVERAGFVERYASECRVLTPELLPA